MGAFLVLGLLASWAWVLATGRRLVAKTRRRHRHHTYMQPAATPDVQRNTYKCEISRADDEPTPNRGVLGLSSAAKCSEKRPASQRSRTLRQGGSLGLDREPHPRGISIEEVHQLPRNAHLTVRNPSSDPPDKRRLLIGRTDGGRP
jgi:hypothetical protein